jgi:hypothetical protein
MSIDGKEVGQWRRDGDQSRADVLRDIKSAKSRSLADDDA